MNPSQILNTLLCALFFIGSYSLQAQEYSISGSIVDAESKSPLAYAHIALSNQDSSFLEYSVSDLDGAFTFTGLAKGSYQLTAQYIGYESPRQTIVIANQNIQAINLQAQFISTELSQIEVVARQIRSIQLGDTIQYNSNAYKVNPDANAGDLIKKMPGFNMNKGQLEAEGEKVAKVLVDGKEYFGDDASAALTNLPAEMIANIQVFDDESDESKSTGISDGETQKTVNIVLKSEYKNATFGQAIAGYSPLDKYQAGISLNKFKDDRRITFLAQSNNINIQNFSTSDLLGVTASTSGGGGRGGRGRGGRNSGGGSASDFLVPNQSGVSTNHAIGLNYQDKWGEKTEVVASYFFNQSDNYANTSLYEDYFNLDEPFVYEEDNESHQTNLNHKFNLKLDIDLNKKSSIRIRPNLTIQQNEKTAETLSNTLVNNSNTNALMQTTSSDLSALNFSNRMDYNYRFEKRGRRFNINSQQSVRNSNGSKINQSLNEYASDDVYLDQESLIDNQFVGWELGANYSEPITEKSSLTASYEIGTERNNNENLTSDYDDDIDRYDFLNEELSNVFKNDYLSQNTSLSYRYRNDKFSGNVRAGYQRAHLENDQTFPIAGTVNRDFNNFLPSAFIRYKFTDESNIRVSYRTRTQLPDAEDLQDFTNISNPLQIQVGNPNLNQQFAHSFDIRYRKNNKDEGRNFSSSFRSTYTQDYISNHIQYITTLDTLAGVPLSEGTQILTPENIGSYWQNNVYFSWGLPLSKLKSNFNITLGAKYDLRPTKIDQVSSTTQNENINLGLVLSSNINENIDFTIRSQSNMEFAQSIYVDNSQTFVQNSSLGLVYFLKKWKFSTNVNHQYLNYINNDLSQQFTFWNASIGRKVMKDNRGEIALQINDILNSNTDIQQSYTENAFIQTQSNALNRFIMLNFSYQIRKL